MQKIAISAPTNVYNQGPMSTQRLLKSKIKLIQALISGFCVTLLLFLFVAIFSNDEDVTKKNMKNTRFPKQKRKGK